MITAVNLDARLNPAHLDWMTPEAALQKQIARYREMNCEQRLLIGLRLHELASEMARSGIRAQNPQANQVEVERELKRRRELAWKS